MTDRLVTVATFLSPIEANLARNQLTANDIESYLADEESASMAWQITGAIGGIKLQVIDSNAGRALAVLEGRLHDDPAAGGPDDGSPTSEIVPTAETAAGLPEEPERLLTVREQLADRALRGAIFGILFYPLHLIVFWLLLRIFMSGDRLAPDKRRTVTIATLINLPFMVGFGVFMAFMLRALAREF